MIGISEKNLVRYYVVRGTVLVGDPLMDRMTDGSTPADRFLCTIGFPVTSYVEFEKEVGKKKSMVSLGADSEINSNGTLNGI